MKNSNIIYGTWELDGKHKELTKEQIGQLIAYAKKCGIWMFDTALVYGNGNVEKYLGEFLTETDYVLTKIPAKSKPELTDENVDNFYSEEYVENCLNTSLENLKRKSINCVLFHNWSYGWNEKVISYLTKLKEKGLVKQIGISLPNGYLKPLKDEILEKIDVIEIPYNESNLHNKEFINYYKSKGKIVYIRSIFNKGKQLGNDKLTNCAKLIGEAKEFNCPLVIGMTNHKQIHYNSIFTQDSKVISSIISESIFDNNYTIKTDKKCYNLNRLLFGTLSYQIDSPLHCVSVSNNSLSVDIWKGCPFQCKYCHVQGIYEDIQDLGRMDTVASRRNACSVEEIVTSLFSHPYFIPNETVISIGTSCTEPLASGEVLNSTMEIMRTFVKYGLTNPFWIVTKAGVPDKFVNEIKEIAENGNKIILSICYAGNPKEIEPAQNNRFLNVEKVAQIENVNVCWYLRPLAREWGANKENLKRIFENISKKYGKYIKYIVPGGLRWTEGIEYALTEINKVEMPQLQKDDNIKTLDVDIIEYINQLCEKHFEGVEVFYNSSCPVSRILGKENINISNILKNNCGNSKCNKVCSKVKFDEQTLNNFNFLMKSLGIEVEFKGIENSKLKTMPAYKDLHYVQQQILKQFIAEYFNTTN